MNLDCCCFVVIVSSSFHLKLQLHRQMTTGRATIQIPPENGPTNRPTDQPTTHSVVYFYQACKFFQEATPLMVCFSWRYSSRRGTPSVPLPTYFRHSFPFTAVFVLSNTHCYTDNRERIQQIKKQTKKQTNS